MVKQTYTQEQVDLKDMSNKVSSIEKTVNDISRKLEANYVTKDELKLLQIQVELLQKIVYGVVGLIITAVVSAGLMFLTGQK